MKPHGFYGAHGEHKSDKTGGTVDRPQALANNVTTMLLARELVSDAASSFGDWLDGQIFPRYGVNEFAEMVGVSPSAVSSWLNHGAVPYKQNCRRIAEALGVDVAVVYAAAGYKTEPRKRPEPEPERPAVQFFDAETLTDEEAAELGRLVAEQLAKFRAKRQDKER